ncbi:unnamed protein product [marine sediment metagenome]|uniref:Arrestin-like N-terminal domain-containing protein n=1 Tax=marine sediment metagenome TaxID=412755 RepID=X1T6Q9_9ZZZZ
MQISQVQVQIGNIIYPLTEGQPLPIKAGDVIRVFFTIRGRVPQDTEVEIWASVYHYALGFLNKQETAQTKGTTILEGTVEFKDYERMADIEIGEIIPGSGLYGLIVELRGYEDAEGNPIEAKIPDCLEFTATPGIFDMIGPILILGLLAFMLPMLKEGI